MPDGNKISLNGQLLLSQKPPRVLKKASIDEFDPLFALPLRSDFDV